MVAGQVAGKTGTDIDRAVAFVTIEAQSAWSGFAREFYLSCAFLHPKTIGGKHVSHSDPTIVNERLALLHSIHVLKGKNLTTPKIAPREEPSWHEKRTLPKLANSLSFSNDPAVLTGLSYPTTFFDELPTVRNFYAHRSFGTVDKVFGLATRKYRSITINHPNELINVIFAGRAQTLLQEWLTDMKQIGFAICQ